MSFAGCIGSLRENMFLLKFYSFCLLIFFLGEISYYIWFGSRIRPEICKIYSFYFNRRRIFKLFFFFFFRLFFILNQLKNKEIFNKRNFSVVQFGLWDQKVFSQFLVDILPRGCCGSVLMIYLIWMRIRVQAMNISLIFTEFV